MIYAIKVYIAVDTYIYFRRYFLDGDTDLLLWPEPWTEAQKALKVVQRKMDKLYETMSPVYKKIWALAGEKNLLLAKVRQEQGRC